MYPVNFDYLKPNGIGEAIELLRRYGDDAKLLAGGQSLVPMMKLRVARPKYLIDIHRIGDLNYIREEAGQIRIGAMTRHMEIEDSPLLAAKLPILREAASEIGDGSANCHDGCPSDPARACASGTGGSPPPAAGRPRGPSTRTPGPPLGAGIRSALDTRPRASRARCGGCAPPC